MVGRPFFKGKGNKMRKTILILMAALVFSHPSSKASSTTDYGHLSKITLESFRCGTYATYAHKKEVVPILYERGIEAGREFIKAARNGKVTDKEFQSAIPMFMGWILQEGGPSDDFILGRVFEQSTSMAAESIIKKDKGRLLPVDKWVLDSDLQKSIALNKYEDGNCWALAQPDAK